MRHLLFAAAAVLVPDDVLACGGFFCSTGPVDQSAERILFEIDEDGASTAIVEVKFNGDPGDFSWVVPVPEVPVVDVVPGLVLDVLDQQAAPRIVPPPLSYESCDEDAQPVGPSSGCGAPPPSTDRADGAGGKDYASAPPSDVDVVELPRVGPYADIVVVSSDDPEALIEWLNDEGYVITTAMRPLVEQYVAEGQKFLALKLAPDAGVQDLAPIKFTCPGVAPVVPIRLTAVAAEPHMKVVVHVAAAATMLPLNYRVATIDEDDLRTDLWGTRSNYDALLALAVQDEGGQAFVVERAGDASALKDTIAAVSPSNDDEEDAQAYLVALLQRRPVLTRLTTRLSARDMTEDPVFVAADVAASGVLDLSSRPARDVCAPAQAIEPACGFAYCGVGARCAVDDDGAEGCVCASGFVARRVVERAAFGGARDVVVCQDPTEDRLGADRRIADPCAGFACGAGTCVAVNGFPTCDCGDEGAFVDAERGGLDCRPTATTYDVDVVRAVGAFTTTTSACATTKARAPLEFALLFVVALAVRRRR